MQPEPVPRSNRERGFLTDGAMESASFVTQCSVSGRGMRTGGRARRLSGPNGCVPMVRERQIATGTMESGLPRIYWSGSPRTRRATIASRSVATAAESTAARIQRSSRLAWEAPRAVARRESMRGDQTKRTGVCRFDVVWESQRFGRQ